MLTEKQTFKQQVRVIARLEHSEVPFDVVDGIADIFASRGQKTPNHIGLIIALAQHEVAQMGAAHKTETRERMAEWVLSLRTPEALLSCRQREEAVRSYVEQLRRDYFRSEKVPFPSYVKAVEWLRQQAVVGRRPTPTQMVRLTRDVTQAMQRFPKSFALTFKMGHHAIPLLAPQPGVRNGAENFEVLFDKGSALEHLKTITKAMASGTGCSVPLCVAHVLAGAPLMLSPLRWRHEVTFGCGLQRRSARIDILQPHAVTLPVLAHAFRLIRKKLGLAKKKKMTGRHERLLRLVEKRGGIPREGKEEFWKDIQRGWNKAVPKGAHPYETWRGPLMAYRRIHKALTKR